MGAEVVPVNVKSKKGVNVVEVDEEFTKVKFDKVKDLKPAFKKGQLLLFLSKR